VNYPAWRPPSRALDEILPNQPCRPGDHDTWLHSSVMRQPGAHRNHMREIF
jgi:hypothetical protein